MIKRLFSVGQSANFISCSAQSKSYFQQRLSGLCFASGARTLSHPRDKEKPRFSLNSIWISTRIIWWLFVRVGGAGCSLEHCRRLSHSALILHWLEAGCGPDALYPSGTLYFSPSEGRWKLWYRHINLQLSLGRTPESLVLVGSLSSPTVSASIFKEGVSLEQKSGGFRGGARG